MTLQWLIEDFERDNSFRELADEVRRQGMECRVIRYEPYESGSLDLYKEDEHVLFQGSIQFANQVKKEKSGWTVWATWRNFLCSTYYAHWGKWLLNDKYLMMPFGDLKRRYREFLDAWTSRDASGAFFVRPDSNQKTFCATVLTGERDFGSAEKTANTWSGLLYDPPPEELVVVAPVQRIHKEWRVVCTRGKVVTGSRYKTWGQVDYKAELPHDVARLALEICSGDFQPDPMYVLDICDSPEKGLRLLEAGAFSVAGLYHCDLEAVVRTAAGIAGGQLLKGET